MANTTIPVELSSTPGIVDNSNATAITIDSSENVGIGTSSPNVLGHFYKGSSGRTWTPDGADVLAIENNDSIVLDIRTPNSNQGLILFSDAAARGRGIVGYAHSSDHMYFNTSGAERLRIDSSGYLLVGTTSVPSGGTDSQAVFKGNNSLGVQGATGTNTGDIRFYNPSGAKYWQNNSNQTAWYFADADFSHYAYLGQNMTAWAFGSDRRLKENIEDISYGLDAVKAMQPRSFTFKSTGVETIGFIAQELAEVIPEAVLGEEIEYLESDSPQEKAEKSMGVSKETLIPVLVKAIQEQQTIIDNLTTRIEALEG